MKPAVTTVRPGQLALIGEVVLQAVRVLEIVLDQIQPQQRRGAGGRRIRERRIAPG